MNDPDRLHHLRRINRLAFALKAPIGQWVNTALARVLAAFGDAAARAVRRQLDEAFVDLVSRLDANIVN